MDWPITAWTNSNLETWTCQSLQCGVGCARLESRCLFLLSPYLAFGQCFEMDYNLQSRVSPSLLMSNHGKFENINNAQFLYCSPSLSLSLSLQSISSISFRIRFWPGFRKLALLLLFRSIVHDNIQSRPNIQINMRTRFQILSIQISQPTKRAAQNFQKETKRTSNVNQNNSTAYGG